MKANPFKNHVWRVIQLEGYCLINTCVQGKYIYPLHGEKISNPNYDPRAKKPKFPEYCPGSPKYICFDKGCEYFGYCEYDPE